MMYEWMIIHQDERDAMMKKDAVQEDRRERVRYGKEDLTNRRMVLY